VRGSWEKGPPSKDGIFWLAIDSESPPFGDVALCWVLVEDEQKVVEVLEHDGSIKDDTTFPLDAVVAHWSEPVRQPPYNPAIFAQSTKLVCPKCKSTDLGLTLTSDLDEDEIRFPTVVGLEGWCEGCGAELLWESSVELPVLRGSV
jgi:hypothetical protein